MKIVIKDINYYDYFSYNNMDLKFDISVIHREIRSTKKVLEEIENSFESMYSVLYNYKNDYVDMLNEVDSEKFINFMKIQSPAYLHFKDHLEHLIEEYDKIGRELYAIGE